LAVYEKKTKIGEINPYRITWLLLFVVVEHVTTTTSCPHSLSLLCSASLFLLWFLFFKRRFLLYAISKKSNKEKDAMVNNAITVIFSTWPTFTFIFLVFFLFFCHPERIL
jgi:hypothetical protein